MPPYSFQFKSSMEIYEIRQQLAELKLGILHSIKLNHPYVIVHYATFNNEQIRSEIELHGKLIGNWMFLPYHEN
jgi:hypothetical protein